MSGWKRHRALECRLMVTSAACFVLSSVAPTLGTAILVTNSSSCNGIDCVAVVAVSAGSDGEGRDVHSVSEDGGNEDTCFTAGCNHTAAIILENMDRNVDPCESFYRFACGGYLNRTKIPEDESFVNSYVSTQRKVSDQLKKIVEAKIEPNEPEAFRLVATYYKSCMNERAIEARGAQPLLESMRRIGGWPVLEGNSWSATKFDWKKSTYELRKAGHSFNHFIELEVNVDLKNTTRHAIYLGQGHLGLEPEYLIEGLDNKIVSAYYKYMVDVATSLGADKPRAERQLRESLDFEMKLANISISTKNSELATVYNPMTLEDLAKKYSSVPWKEHVGQVLPSSILPLEKNEYMIVMAPDYIAELEKLMANTSSRVHANYVGWIMAKNSMSYLNDEMRKKVVAYEQATTGVSEGLSRWKQCVQGLSDLSFALDAMYVRKNSNKVVKRKAAEMVEDIRQAFRQLLLTANWMDEKTRSRAVKKFERLSSHVAYSDKLFDNQKLDEFYKELKMSEDKYYENCLKVSLLNLEYSLGKLRKSAKKDESEFSASAILVNAFYNGMENSVELEAAMLQDVFFDNDRPGYMNYGAIGTIIGHEMTHGFDNDGRQLDENGQLADWWEPSTEKEYLNRVQCIIDQYSNYTVEEVGLRVNGDDTRSENIADNGGFKVAYLAYEKSVARNGKEARLPGIDMTPNQLFWMSGANMWCEKYKAEALKNLINTDQHSHGEIRILGSLSNRPEFAKDFGCRLGSKMNPEEKCTVW